MSLEPKPRITWDFGPWGADLRRLWTSRRFRVWAGLIGVCAAALCFAPLFNTLGYEFSIVAGGIAGLASGYLGAAAVDQARRLRRNRSVGSLFCLAWTLSAALIAVPFALISLNALRVHNCHYAAGLMYYALIPLVSVTYGSAAGVFFGLWAATLRRASLLWTLWVAGSIAAAAAHVLIHPPIFAYHSLLGLVQGAIYDDEMTASWTLLAARALALLTACAFLTAAWTFHSPQRQRLSLRALFYGKPKRRLPAALLAFCAAGLAFGWIYRSEIGWRPTRAALEAALSGRYDTKHFIIRYDDLPSIRDDIEQIALDHEYRYDQLRKFFGFELNSKIRSYIYTDGEMKRRLQGSQNAHMADPFNLEIHLLHDPFPHRSLKHELAHLFAGEFQPVFKLSPAVGLIEGAAEAAAWDDARMTPHQKSKHMLLEERLPRLKTLMSPVGFWQTPSGRSYAAAGSFSRWLIEEHGIEAFGRAYAAGDFKKAYNRSLSALEKDWLFFLAEIPLNVQQRVEAQRIATRLGIFDRACPHVSANLRAEGWEHYARGNYAKAERAFQKLAEMEPNDPEHARRILWTQRAAHDWEGLKRSARELSMLKNAGVYRLMEAMLAFGDAFWWTDAPEMARKSYATIVERPPGSDLYRAAAVKLSALELDGESQEWARRGLGDQRPEIRIYALQQLRIKEPEWRYGAYLLGRALYNAREWGGALDLLNEAGRKMEDREFVYETLRLRALCLYRLNRLHEASSAFQSAADASPLDAGRRAMMDWHERVQWLLDRPPLLEADGRAQDVDRLAEN